MEVSLARNDLLDLSRLQIFDGSEPISVSVPFECRSCVVVRSFGVVRLSVIDDNGESVALHSGSFYKFESRLLGSREFVFDADAPFSIFVEVEDVASAEYVDPTPVQVTASAPSASLPDQVRREVSRVLRQLGMSDEEISEELSEADWHLDPDDPDGDDDLDIGPYTELEPEDVPDASSAPAEDQSSGQSDPVPAPAEDASGASDGTSE